MEPISYAKKKTRARKPVKNPRPKIGEIFEIETEKGLAYFQYNVWHHEWGYLVRVLKGFYETRPTKEALAELVKKPHRFQKFVGLYYATKDKKVTLVDRFDVPEFAAKLPIFKGTNHPKKHPAEDKTWYLWDGEKSWKVGKLSLEEQHKYPLRGLSGIGALKIFIERGYLGTDKLC